MGLDITYYRNAKPITAEQQAALLQQPEDERHDWADEHGIERIYVNPHFPGREQGIPGQYVVAEEAGGFRAGSYGGYGTWRSQLAALVGIVSLDRWWKDPKPGPFAELLEFADNEGVIGPIVSRKLAVDFADWQARAEVFAPTLGNTDDGWFIRKYNEWRAAFEAARDDGYVDFH